MFDIETTGFRRDSDIVHLSAFHGDTQFNIYLQTILSSNQQKYYRNIWYKNIYYKGREVESTDLRLDY